MKTKIAMLISMFFLLSGCTSIQVKEQSVGLQDVTTPPPTGKSGLFLYRSDKHTLIESDVEFKAVNGGTTFETEIYPRTAVRMNVEPGEYIAEGDLGGPGDIAQELRLNLKEGMVTYVEFSAKRNFIPLSSGNSYLKRVSKEMVLDEMEANEDPVRVVQK